MKKLISSKYEQVLEVGCGSGLIYRELVPNLVNNQCYTGIDISSQMLKIAKKRFPQGKFHHGDAYALEFSDNSFDISICIEVLGHLPKISQVISELFRVSKRMFIFTTWISPSEDKVISKEIVNDTEFIHTEFTLKDILGSIRKAIPKESYRVEVKVLNDLKWAFCIYKEHDSSLTPKETTIVSFPASTELYLEEIKKKENEFKQIQLDKEAEIELLANEMLQLRKKGLMITKELDQFRHLKIVRLNNRLRNKGSAWDDISPAFQQLKDDSLIFNQNLKGFRLQPSINLQRLPFIAYPLDLGRSNLQSILLAPIIDTPMSQGVFGIEIISSLSEIVTQKVIPLVEINELQPVQFDFDPIPKSDKGQFWLRVFVQDAEAPIRIFEWRKYAMKGFGRLKTLPFCGYDFGDNP
jgi:ubiquinone/menaquinone biosynthesis C-methylase UbiE